MIQNGSTLFVHFLFIVVRSLLPSGLLRGPSFVFLSHEAEGKGQKKLTLTCRPDQIVPVGTHPHALDSSIIHLQ